MNDAGKGFKPRERVFELGQQSVDQNRPRSLHDGAADHVKRRSGASDRVEGSTCRDPRWRCR
jgi:hypothetical protein